MSMETLHFTLLLAGDMVSCTLKPAVTEVSGWWCCIRDDNKVQFHSWFSYYTYNQSSRGKWPTTNAERRQMWEKKEVTWSSLPFAVCPLCSFDLCQAISLLVDLSTEGRGQKISSQLDGKSIKLLAKRSVIWLNNWQAARQSIDQSTNQLVRHPVCDSGSWYVSRPDTNHRFLYFFLVVLSWDCPPFTGERRVFGSSKQGQGHPTGQLS